MPITIHKVSRDSGQAALLKTIVVLGVVVLLLVDLGRPFVARVNLDGKAKDVALASSDNWRRTHDEQAARQAADAEAARSQAWVTAWSVRQDNTVTVTIEKEQPSWIFGKIFKSWYKVTATQSDKATG